MVALKPIEELKRKRDQLLKTQEDLIQILKTKHKDAYDWMKENNISLLDLKVYSVSLATALVVGMASANQPVQVLPQLEQLVNVIETDELRGKTEEQKAELVWKRYGHVIERNAKKYNLDSKLIFVTVMIESGGDTYAIRHEPRIGDASYGLGQILYGTARGLGFEGSPQDLYDPEVNIELIARYHRRNQDVYGGDLTPEQLTTAYNSGSPYNSPLPGHLTKFSNWYGKAGSFIG